ncbi:MAG TPA: hypothetical protein VGE63_01180 [Candidatus Paceibacterota bacterium]
MKSKVELLQDGDGFAIKFSDGTHSQIFTSKKEGFELIKALADDNKLTSTEFRNLRDSILEKPEIPWTESSSGSAIEVTVISLGGFGGGPFGSMGFPFALAMILGGDRKEQREPVDIAYFDVCACGRHGQIVSKTKSSDDLWSQDDALDTLQSFKEENLIDDTEFEKLKKEIEESTLN